MCFKNIFHKIMNIFWVKITNVNVLFTYVKFQRLYHSSRLSKIIFQHIFGKFKSTCSLYQCYFREHILTNVTHSKYYHVKRCFNECEQIPEANLYNYMNRCKCDDRYIKYHNKISNVKIGNKDEPDDECNSFINYVRCFDLFRVISIANNVLFSFCLPESKFDIGNHSYLYNKGTTYCCLKMYNTISAHAHV